ncbi:hypothetical protein A0H81_14418 [Grifola frondosa]|uniref:Uncharacterized protein n=1 Tax=Grifola frondosa TaxID=5627 RepID=A0A1C7LLF0_GRIFR|nr:hypothetical protein A0H81_14418 [Grifola frondosa]
MVVVDNCCHVRGAIVKVFPNTRVVLDVWHFLMRYLAWCYWWIKKSSPERMYWNQEEQEVRIVAAYEKWARNGGVWNAAAEKVHADQLAHVQKGCLARLRQDVPSDGSHIEGSHKHWNGLQRSYASGLESMTALSHDYILRRNRLHSPSLAICDSHPIVTDVDAFEEAPAIGDMGPGTPANDGLNQSREILKAIAMPRLKRKSEVPASSNQERGDRNGKGCEWWVLVPPVSSRPTASVSSSLSMLPLLTISGLSRSQRIFSVATGINVLSLSITAKHEYLVFMDLRLEQQWTSFAMTPRKWVTAANDYNARLESVNRSNGRSTIYKTPRALMEKLGAVEPEILSRFASSNFTSKGESEDFWHKHCHAVPALVKTEAGDKKKRKNHVCLRCKKLMWPGPEAHPSTTRSRTAQMASSRNRRRWNRRSMASSRPSSRSFPNGHNHPACSRTEHISIPQRSWPWCATCTRFLWLGGNGGDRFMEYLAFADMLQKRTAVEPGMILFKLFNSLQLGSVSPELIVERDGVRYLRVNILYDNNDGVAESIHTDSVTGVIRRYDF